jgi:hypothetical protein
VELDEASMRSDVHLGGEQGAWALQTGSGVEASNAAIRPTDGDPYAVRTRHRPQVTDVLGA